MIYKSNLGAPPLRNYFTHAVDSDGPYGHSFLHDEDFEPHCGYMTDDEAAILYNWAVQIGGMWLEIGTHTGWSLAHILSAGVEAIGVDPQFANPQFLARTKENLAACGLDATLFDGTSEQYFAVHEKQTPDLKFAGVCIDGNHDAPMPTLDAKLVLPYLAKDCAVIFHDYRGYPIRDGAAFLVDEGFTLHEYLTPNGMAVCARGGVSSVVHIGDAQIQPPWSEWWKARRYTKHHQKAS